MSASFRFKSIVLMFVQYKPTEEISSSLLCSTSTSVCIERLHLVDGNFRGMAATHGFFAARLQWVVLNVTTSQYDVDRHTYDSYDS